MAKITQQVSICTALHDQGEREVVPSPTRKARCFEARIGLKIGRLFVGKAGSLRFGPNYSNCYPVSEAWRCQLINRGVELIMEGKRK
jgi:hypothetical protein